MKKRVLAILLLLCMVFSLLPLGAAAAEPSSKSIVWVNPLYQNVVTVGEVEAACDEIRAHANAQTLDTPSFTTDAAAAKYLRRQMCKRVETITFRVSGPYQGGDYPNKLFAMALEHTGVPNEGDYLTFQYYGVHGTITSYGSDTDCLYDLTIPYYTSASQEAAVTSELKSIMPGISNAGGEYVRTKAIYDYICNNVTYDNVHLNDNDYLLQYTAYAALIQKTAVCQGYALLFYRMALEAGLDARIITSNSLDHAWNIVRNGRLYYYLDSTWDSERSPYYHYFMCGQNDFEGHSALDTQYTDGSGFAERYPLASTRYVPPYSPLQIYYNPADVTAQVNTRAEFSVSAGGEGLSYLWQYSTNNGKTWNSTGVTTSTLYCDVVSTTPDSLHRCVITDAYGDRAVSRSAKLTVTGLRIKSQPRSVSVKGSNTATFTVKAGGDSLRYQWQFKAPGGNWKDCPSSTTGSKAASLKLKGVSGKLNRDGYKYRCRITDGSGNTITSNTVTLRVLAVTSQPKAASANVGETVKFTAKASGKSLTYRWQCKVSGGSWKNTTLSGYKTATLTVPATKARNGYQYRCKITDSAGNTVTTKAVKLTVQKLHVTKQPKAASANLGETVKFKAKASGKSLTYKWQCKAQGGSWKNSTLPGHKTATLKVSATKARNGYQYRCKITDSAGHTVTTKAVKLTVQKMKITAQPKSTTAKAGTTVKFSVKATGFSLKYQWQCKVPGGTWKNTTLSGYKTATLKIPATKARSGYQYRCKITDSAGTKITSKTVKLTVKR